MSFSKQITIWCDTCTNWDQFSHISVKEARKILKERGWKTKKTENGIKDYCPECVKNILKDK